MLTPLLATFGILGALYVTRGPITAVWPNRRYLLGAPQPPGAPPATKEDIEATRAFIEGLGFADVAFQRSTLEDGRRYYWFKGRWQYAPRELRETTATRVYEVLF